MQMRMTNAIATDVAATTRVAQCNPRPVHRSDTKTMGIGNQAALRRLSRTAPRVQRKLTIGAVNDPLEAQADRVADQVMRMPDPNLTSQDPPQLLHRKCAECEEEDKKLQKKSDGQTSAGGAAPAIVHEVLNTPGQPLDAATRAFFEPKFGMDLNHVRTHTDGLAASSARAVNADAYTLGSDIVFGESCYAPAAVDGRGLIAHELAHVVRQDKAGSSTPIVQRQASETGMSDDDADMAAEREYGDGPAPNAKKCAIPSGCPPGFCDPYSSQKLAEYYRAKKAGWLLAGIAAAVNSRVVPLWRDYLFGGSPPKNLSADFGKDFTNSPTTAKTTRFLYDELKKSLIGGPPSVPSKSKAVLGLGSLIPTPISALDDPNDRAHKMNFSVVRDIPGNIAGDIGKDQTSCLAGAQPSPFNDERNAGGTVAVERKSNTELFVTPDIKYTVKDTIDLCPGNCGTMLEQVATVPMSQFEATGISGDVPFIVDFPAPPLGSFTISVPAPAVAPAPKVP